MSNDLNDEPIPREAEHRDRKTGEKPDGEGAFGNTIREHTVVPEAEWGETSGTVSGGIAGGTPADQPPPERKKAA